jgi:hypothetical protein
VDGRELAVSNLEKVLYPATGFTKGQLIDYYARVADVMLAHVMDRPLTMKRYPNGVDSKFFFEKHVPAHAPAWVHHKSVPSTSNGGSVDYPVVCDRPTGLGRQLGRHRVPRSPVAHRAEACPPCSTRLPGVRPRSGGGIHHRRMLPCGQDGGGDPR